MRPSRLLPPSSIVRGRLLLGAGSELQSLLETGKVDIDVFQQELQLRGHAIHLSGNYRYARLI